MNNSSSNNKKKLLIPVIIAVVAIAVLAIAFFSGGDSSDSKADGDLQVSYGDAVMDPTGIEDGTCKISIVCNTVLDNMDDLKSGKETIIPADGVILAETTVEFEGGDSVFDVLDDVAKANKIHLEYSESPLYNTMYIEGINNLYEFDCGELSGWMYCLNGVYTGVGCSRVYVQDGDVIEFIYTCALGNDVGAEYEAEVSFDKE